MPRAKEHVDALMLQFEGLKASIADLEEQIKRVSNLSFNKQTNLTRPTKLFSPSYLAIAEANS